MRSCKVLSVTLFLRGVSNDSSRTARKRRPRNQPCGKVHPDTKCPTRRLRFPAAQHHRYSPAHYPRRCHNPRQLPYHDLHAPLRCVHLRTDVESHHKQRVESPYRACTPLITPVRHRSRHPAEPPVPSRVLMFSVGSCAVARQRRHNPRRRAPR